MWGMDTEVANALGFVLVAVLAVWVVGWRYRDRLTRTQWLLVTGIGVLLVVAATEPGLVVVGLFALLAGGAGAATTGRKA